MGEPDEQLADEQERLEETYAAFDGALRRLVGRNTRALGVDDFADEALERMRRERIRVYTEASGPLYFGRIDPEDGDPLYIGRHVVVDAHNRVLVSNWRAPAAESFYAATAHEPRVAEGAGRDNRQPSLDSLPRLPVIQALQPLHERTPARSGLVMTNLDHIVT